MTFDLNGYPVFCQKRKGWAFVYEVSALCRNCQRPTIFRIAQDKTEVPNGGNVFDGDWVITQWFEVESFVNLKDLATQKPPDHVPEDVARAFREAATCVAVECWNAAGAMLRTTIDLATRAMLPNEDTEGLDKRVRRDLGLRLPWLFKNGLLPRDLESISACIREDGNDGVHAALLEKADAEDLLDFTMSCLSASTRSLHDSNWRKSGGQRDESQKQKREMPSQGA
ncbi:MAG TPA: DUF4145 domain-containing protein [Methyloceanibacter sp.]|nr:DUF4145 domain-containing protein [Methyloceanibacter sp.]